MISADGSVVEGVAHTSPPVLRVGLDGLPLCSGFGSCSCRCPIQGFSCNSTFPDVQQDENIPCRSLQTGTAREQQKLTVNIYFSPAICASSAVLHKSKNIVKLYCCSKPMMYTNPELDQYIFFFIKVPCPRNSAQLNHQKLRPSSTSLHKDNSAPCWMNGKYNILKYRV